MDKIDLNALILFYEVVNAQSIGKAALRSGVPKATISRRLRQLEKDVGAILLKRGPRKLTMTDVGHVVYEHCVRIANEAQDASQAVLQAQSQLRGTLRVSMPVAFGAELVTGAIAQFCHQHPEVNVVVQATNQWVDVSEEPYDLAIHLGRVQNERLPVRRLAEVARGVYASPDYCRARGMPQTALDLLKHDCIALDTQISDGLWALNGPDGRSRGDAIEFRARVSDISVVRALTLAGLGIGIMPTMLSHRLVQEGKLVRLLEDWPVPPVIASATFLERRHLSLMIRVFLDLLVKQIEPRQDAT